MILTPRNNTRKKIIIIINNSCGASWCSEADINLAETEKRTREKYQIDAFSSSRSKSVSFLR